MSEKKTKKKRELVDDSSDQSIVSANGRVDYTKPDPKSGKRRPYGGTGEGNPSHAHIPQEERCSSTKRKTGEPCQRLPIKGTTLCYVHGGAAPQIARAAMVRVQNKALELIQAEIDIALDEDEPSPVRLAALRDALDRAGIKSSEKLNVTHEVPRYEQLLTQITRVPSERMREETEQRQIETGDDRW